MPRIPVNRLRPGWYVLNPVCDDRGNLLLGPGVKLKEYFIERLRNLGLPAIDVTLAPHTGAGAAALLTAETRTRALRSLALTVDSIRAGVGWDALELDGCVRAVVREVTRNSDSLIGLTDIRAARAYIYAHSVNVCALSVLIGRELGYPFEDLVELGTGALLHDIGLAFLGQAKFGRYGPYALDHLSRRKHPRLGFQVLLAQGAISSKAAMVALEHHETLDGSGYPDAITGKRISEYGLIAAVADLYDTLSCDQPHRAGLVPARCVSALRRAAQRRLPADVIEALVRNIALYPAGTLVRLSTGSIGVVVGFDRTSRSRPDIRVVADADWNPLTHEVLRLRDHPEVHIVEQMTAMAYDLTPTAEGGSGGDSKVAVAG